MTEVVERLGINLQVKHMGKVRDTELYQSEDFAVISLDTVDLSPSEIKYGAVELVTTPTGQYYLVRGQDTTLHIPGEAFLLGNRSFGFVPSASYHLPATESSSLLIAHYNPQNIAAGMVGRLLVNRKGRSNTVQIGYSDVVPQRAADVANYLIKLYNEKIIRERTLMGQQTVGFIDERLGFVSRELFAVEASLSSLRQREGIVVDPSVRGSSYLEQLNTADMQLAELEVRKSLISEIRNQLQQLAGTYTPVSVASEVIQGALAQLINRYNALIFERDQRLEAATPENPIVATYDEQLRELSSNIQRSLSTLYRETEAHENRVRARISPIERSLNAIPDNERQVLQIMRQQQIKQNLFVFLMEKREEAAITIAAQIPNTRIIDPARPSFQAISPKPTQSYIMAIGLGLLLPGMFFFLREVFNTKVQQEKEVETRIHQTIVGRIAKSGKQDEIVVTRGNRSAVAEMFRLLRTNLTFLFPLKQTPVVLITSGISGEGKTYVSSNLGHAFALADKRTVMVGADMRKPRLYNAINTESKKSSRVGLSNYLIGKASYEDIVQPTNTENLFMIESGPIPPNPSELLLRPQIIELIDRLKQDFDVVIIDSPPVGLVTDALQLGDHVDLTLYVVKLGYTPKASLEVLREMAAPGKLPNVQVIINGVEFERGYGYGKGYYK
jgi:capsular exopolysaccharide synthesis family protein